MANDVSATLSVTVLTIQVISPAFYIDPFTTATSNMAPSTTMEISPIPTTLPTSSVASPSHSRSTITSVNSSSTTNSSATNPSSSTVPSPNASMARANVVIIATLTSVFGVTVIVLAMLLLRNYFQRRRNSQDLGNITRSWRGGNYRRESQVTDKFVRMFKEPLSSPRMVQSRPVSMQPQRVPVKIGPPPIPRTGRRYAPVLPSPSASPLSPKEWLAEDVGMENAGLGSGKGGLGRQDLLSDPPPPFPHPPTSPPPGPPAPVADPRPRPRPRPRPMDQISRAPRSIGRLNPGSSVTNSSMPSLQTITSERLEHFYAPWVREMMGQGRREIRVRAMVGQRNPDGRIRLPRAGRTMPGSTSPGSTLSESTVPRTAGRES